LFSDICSLRLDFNTFVIVGPQTGTTTVTIAPEIGSLCPDSFTVTVCCHSQFVFNLHFCY
jgi:hypothetical protein